MDGYAYIRYGSYKTDWRRLKRLGDEGVWYRIFKALASMRSYGRVSVDDSTVGAKKRGACKIRWFQSIRKAQRYMYIAVDKGAMPFKHYRARE